MDRVPNAGWMKELTKDGLVILKEDKIAKRVYVGECAGNCSVGRHWKKWTDTVK